MKIALFVDQFPKVSETFILNQIDGLLARGHEITIFPSLPVGESLLHRIVEKRRLVDMTHYPPGAASTVCEKLEFYAWLLKLYVSPGISVSRLKQTHAQYRGIGNWHWALQKAKPVLDDAGEFDVLLAHFGPNGLRASWYRDAGFVSGALVTVFHGFDLSSHLRFHDDRLYDPLFRKGDLFLPISHYWEARLRDLGCPANKLAVHHVGIDCDHFTFQPRKRAAQQPTVLISVARLVEKKGLEYAIRALAELNAPAMNIEYRIIGDGPLLDPLRALVSELGLGDHVSFLGVRTSEQVAVELNQAHLFLAPSVTSQSGDMEGIPVVLMEAMATGMPVISTRHSGIPELVDEGISGRLVGERDVSALAAAVKELARHVECWSSMGMAGRKKVLDEFDNNALNQRLESLLVSLAGEESKKACNSR